MQLSDNNFALVAFDKNHSSLTLQVLQFPAVVTLVQKEMTVARAVGRTV